MSSQKFPWARFAGYSAVLMGMGYALMKATTPTEQQLYDEMAPDLRRKVDKARATRLAREAEMKKQVGAQVAAADEDPENVKPIWAEPPPQKKERYA